MKINDLDLKNWRDLDHIWTDSLWLIPKRDNSGAHSGHYHGNFVSQIPYQCLERYTRAGDVVLDPYLGSGTTLIEARRTGRHGIGIEIQPELAKETRQRILTEPALNDVHSCILNADSTDLNETPAQISSALDSMGQNTVQLVMMHPPYHSIVKFSEMENDISNCASVERFLDMFGKSVDLVTPYLDPERYLVLVMGDMYANSEWIPLGAYCMLEVLQRDYILKSQVIKDMQGNRAKRNQERLWRYRALNGGYYIFKHESVYFFEKKKPKKNGEKKHFIFGYLFDKISQWKDK